MLQKSVLLLASALSAASAATIVNLGNETFGSPSCDTGSIDNPVNPEDCQAALSIIFEQVCDNDICELTAAALGATHNILAAVETCEVDITFEGENISGVTFNQPPISAAVLNLVASCNKPFAASGSNLPTVLSIDGQLKLSYKMNVGMDG